MQTRWFILGLCMSMAAGCSGAGSQVRTLAPSDQADAIALTDGTTFKAELLQTAGMDVFIKLDRNSIATINGEELPDPVAEGYAAPGFEIELLGGEKATVGPNQPTTLVKFWATWCPYCQGDVPFVQSLYDHYKDSGLRVLAVNFDQQEDTLKPFLDEHGITYPVAWLSPDDGDALAKRYEAKGIPNYFLVDNQGVIQAVYKGALKPRATMVEDQLRRVLSGTGSALPERLPVEE